MYIMDLGINLSDCNGPWASLSVPGFYPDSVPFSLVDAQGVGPPCPCENSSPSSRTTQSNADHLYMYFTEFSPTLH